EAFFEVCPCMIIGVTGSDGKTTTTTLIGEILRAEGKTMHVGGNIGAPLLDRADAMSKDDFAILELSSFQLITMKKSPQIAVVTNVGPNHLDIHTDLGEYIDAKKNIFRHQNSGGRLVVNLDNEITRGYAREANGDVYLFSARERPVRGVYLQGNAVKCADERGEDVVLTVSDIRIPGAHNVENFMAAIAATRGYVTKHSLKHVAREFHGVEHRIEFVRTLGGVRYYNSSIDSSPARTIAALGAFKQKVILIAGGKDKGVPFDALGPEIAKRVKTLVLTGMTAGAIKRAVESSPEYAGRPEIITEDGFEDAVLKARELAQTGDIVLLSPASTSFDRFSNFEERGNKFKEIVNGLA
ncbi:MAG: UDP-N-acetylmuramoyl-L-alanine--D-glutamate ligase, partial [Clostridiales bacterium]|nr:UDP-N-acetylmuramoyl-L-alanine--D-glutamate ligase [Clostridiales bacterium]